MHKSITDNGQAVWVDESQVDFTAFSHHAGGPDYDTNCSTSWYNHFSQGQLCPFYSLINDAPMPVANDNDGDGIPDSEDDDDDNDGMSDVFENEYGLDPFDPADAGLDNDSDESINLDEFIDGTDPLDWDTDGDGIRDGLDREPTVVIDPGGQVELISPQIQFRPGFSAPDSASVQTISTNPGAPAP